MSCSSAAQLRRSTSSRPEVELLRDHLRVGAHPLGMAACDAIVRAQRRDEPEQPLGGLHGRVRVRAPARALARRPSRSAVVPARSAVRKRDGASSGKTSASLSSAASGSRRRVSRSMPIRTTVAAALRPTHQATCRSAEPLGGPIDLACDVDERDRRRDRRDQRRTHAAARRTQAAAAHRVDVSLVGSIAM